MNAAFEIVPANKASPWLLTCDHASNRVPAEISGGDLGLPADDMSRHIAYDIGAAGVTRHLARALDAPAVLSDFSRLVIDPNRGPEDPTLLMKIYDRTIIPGNRHADEAELARRKALLYDPYHRAIEDSTTAATRALVAIHSFTPQLRGRPPRPWQIGILFAGDDRLSRPLIDLLQADGDLTVGINEPYTGHLPGDAVDRHALRHGRHNTLIELRQDLIATEPDQRAWADRLAPLLEKALGIATAP